MQPVDNGALLTALDLPASSRVDRRVPKKLLLEQGAPTAADRRKIQDGIEELSWVAALKPTNIGVPAFRDDVREYLEIAVLTATLRSKAKPTRLVEVIHRAIHYPVVLVTLHGGAVSLSLPHKRWSQGESGKVVIEELRYTPLLRLDAPTPLEASFLSSLAISGLPRRDLFALCQGWLDRMLALEVARVTGTFVLLDDHAKAVAVRDTLDKHDRLELEIASLRARASNEKQINRLVDLNLEIKRLEAEIAEATRRLG